MTQRFRVALVGLVALAVVTLTVWLLQGGSGGDSDSTPKDRAAPVDAQGRELSAGGRGGSGGPTSADGSAGNGATGGGRTGGVGLTPGMRVPKGMDLSDPEQRKRYLLELLAKGPESWDDVAALIALTTEPLDQAVKDALLAALRTGDRNGVSKALNVAHDPTLVADLLAIVDDPATPPAARRVALLALAQMPGAPADETAKALESRLQGDMNKDVELLDAIARRGGKESVRALVEYLERSSDAARLAQTLTGRVNLKDDPDSAAVVAEALGRRQSPGALDALIAIAGQSGAALAPALIRLDRDDMPEAQRTKVLDALGQTGSTVAIDHLIAVSRQPGLWGEKAILVLANIPDASPEARESLVHELERAAVNPRPELARSALLEVAGRLQVKAALPTMVESLRDPSDQVRNSAVRAMGLLRSNARANVGDVARLFQGGSPATRTAVAVALGNIGGEDAAKALEELLKDPTLDSSLKRTLGYAVEQARGVAADTPAPGR